MSNPTHSFQNKTIKVSFDGNICAHAGICFGELHSVFDGDANPPINLDGGSTEEVIRVVTKCPSSALTYERLDGSANEQAATSNSATIVPNGPVAMRGQLILNDNKYTRLTLCRCGQSQNKPYCDGSHKQVSFDDHQLIDVESVGDMPSEGVVSIKPVSNGPVLFAGTITVNKIDNSVLCQREKGAVCRCGASKNKPFCDGSHKAAGFQAE